MIATLPEMRSLTHELTMSVWTLSAVGVLFESGLVEHLREPCSADDLAVACPAFSRNRLERCLAVAVATGVIVAEDGRYRLAPGVMPFVQQPLRGALAGDVRSHLMQALAFLDSSREEAPNLGWKHTDRVLLQAQGDASAVLPTMLKANLLPGLGDLSTRLEQPRARFLDVGVGVGALAIAMCRLWPELRVVGLDTFDAPLAIARENVVRAGLADRIELRPLDVLDLTDTEVFELAWLPAFFIPEAVLAQAMGRVHAALRPGGCVLLPILGATGDERQRAVAALVTDLWGGPVLSTAAAEALLKEAGYTSVRTSAGPPWAPALVVGQR